MNTRSIKNSNNNWLHSVKKRTQVSVDKICFSDLDQWFFDDQTGNLNHDTGKFFSIIGIDVKTNWGYVNNWKQPIFKQPEIGILGIITKEIDDELLFLMQAKIEPGNINCIQLSPTLQATRSNYTQVHHGNKPLYLEYFLNPNKEIMMDQLQSEQGARFLMKRNRNMIIKVEDDIPVYDNFRWLTLEEITTLLYEPNTVNMDTRTVLSGMLFWGQENQVDDQTALFSFKEIIHWLAKIKVHYELNVKEIPLHSVCNWEKNDKSMHHSENRYFDIIPVRVSIQGREVKYWTQPMIEAKQEGICVFIIKKINGRYHFLVQGKVECGNFDTVEMAPTVQCLTGNYKETGSGNLPYLDYVLNVSQDQIIYDVMQSEEGGRFYHEQNRNMIIEADETLPTDTPDNYIWMTTRQIKVFIMFNNFFNIQARSLIAAMVTQEEKYD